MQVENNPYNTSDDEIDLRELVRTLIRRKKTILLVASLVLLASVVYALFATPVYKAKVSFLPPTLADVAPLNYPGANNGIEPLAIYAQFEKNLNSLELRRKIFDTLYIIKAYANETTNIDAAFSKFNSDLAVEKPIAKKNETTLPAIYLTLKGSDPQILADTLNDLNPLVRNTTKNETIYNVTAQINFQKEQLQREINELRAKAERQKQDEITKLQEVDKVEKNKTIDQINTLRASAKTRRIDHIRALEEAAKVAESIGLAEKSSLLESAQANDKAAFYTEVNTQAQPLYLRGYKALRSEIKELEERKSDDPFIPGLRDLQDKLDLLSTNHQVEALLARSSNDPFTENLRNKESELAVLEAFKIDPTKVSVATLDQAAYPPEKREKPKRLLIVVLGAGGGLFLGIIAAFMANFWQSLRLEDEGKA